MKCKKGYEVEPQRSAAGYYMGTCDEEGCPNCRITTNYAKKRDQAESLPLNNMNNAENRFCNGNGNCFR